MDITQVKKPCRNCKSITYKESLKSDTYCHILICDQCTEHDWIAIILTKNK